MSYELSEKSQNLITTKEFNGDLYALFYKDENKEVWLSVVPVDQKKCVRCGYIGAALDEHHIYGRKNSDETVTLCCNCHREVHSGSPL